MKTTISGHDLIIEKDLREYTENKILKLRKFRQDIIEIEVTLLENHHKKEKKSAFIAKALVIIPGNDINAEAFGKTLFAAVDDLEAKLATQLRKTKEKKLSFKRGKNFLENFFRKEQ